MSGGTVTWAVPAVPDCVDPQTSCSGFEEVSALTSEGLTHAPRDDWSTVEPALAESWTVNDDGSAYTFTLRDDVTFSNGEPLTAEVVKGNFETLRDGLEPTGGTLLLADLDRVNVIDERTAEVVFTKPKTDFLSLTATQDLSLVAPETLAKTWEERAVDGAIGTGPFVATSLDFADGAVFTRRDDYAWAPASLDHGGPAYLDEVSVVVVDEASNRSGALASGQADLANELNAADAEGLEGQGITIELQPEPGLVPQTWILNTTSPGLDDVRVRQAIGLAIDRATVTQKALGKYAEPAKALLRSDSPSFTDLSDHLTYDPERAGQLLDEAGWVRGPDGIRVKNGQPLALVLSVRENHVPVQEVAQEYLREAGIDAQIKVYSGSEYEQVVIDKAYDIHTYGSSNENFADFWLSTAQNRSNLAGPAAVELDGLITAAQGTVDPQQRKAATNAWQELVIEQGYGIPIQDAKNIWGVVPAVHDFEFGAARSTQFYNTWRSE